MKNLKLGVGTLPFGEVAHPRGLNCATSRRVRVPVAYQPTTFSVQLLLLLIVLVLFGGTAYAANRTWDGGGADDNWTTIVNWDGDVTAPSAADLLFFGGATRLVNTNDFAALTTFNGLTFNAGAGAFELWGNSITLGGGITNNETVNLQTIHLNLALGAAARTFSVASGGTLLIDGVISGSVALTKGGAGTLILSGANTFSGGLTVSVGTLQLGNAAGLGTTAGNTVVSSGAVLDLNGQAVGAEPISLTGSLVNNSGTDASLSGTIGVIAGNSVGGSGNMTLSGAISGTGVGLTKVGAGTVTFSGSGANTYNGPTTVNAGTLLLSKTAGVNAIGGVLTIGDGTGGANADVVQWTANDQIATTAVTVNSSGLLDLNGNSDTIGALTVSTGNVAIATGTLTATTGTALTMTGGNVSSTGAGKLVLNGNVVGNASAISATIGGNLDLGAATRTFTIADGTATDDMAVSAIISNGGLTKAGAGTLVLSGVNTYSGATTITVGTLTITGSLGNTAVSVNGVTSVLNLNAASAVSQNTVTVTTGSLGENTVNAISGTAALTVNGGTATLSQANDYTGATTLTTGTLQLQDANAIASSALSLNGGTLQLRNNAATAFNGASTTVGGTTTIDVNRVSAGSGNTLTLGNLSIGANTLNVTGGNTYVLAVGAVTLTATAGGTTVLNPTTAPLIVASVTGSATGVNIDTLQLDGTATANSVTGVIADGAGGGKVAVTKVGSGTWTLSGASGNTYSGLTTVNVGTLVLSKSSGNAIGGNLTIGDGTATDTVQLTGSDQIVDTSAVTIGGSGVLNVNGNSDTIGSLAGVAGGSVTLGSGILTVGDATSTTFGGVISGAGGSLVKQGAGTLTLGAINTYTGNTTISGGAIGLDGDSTLGSGAGTLNLSGGALYITAAGRSPTVNPVANPVNLTADATIAAADGTGFTGTRDVNFNGGFSGSAGTLTLRNIDGTTAGSLFAVRLSAGTFTFARPIVLGQGGDIGAVQLTLANTGASGAQTFDGVISGPGSIVRSISTGTTILNGDNTYTGGTTLTSGSIGFGISSTGSPVVTSGPIGTGALTISGSSMVFASGGARAVGNAIVFTGVGSTLTNAGTDDLTLSGTIDLGTATRTFQVTNTGVTTLSGVISGGVGGALTKAGASTLVLSGANTYSGDTTITAGTIKLGAAGVIPNGTGKGNVSVGAAGTLDLAGFSETINGLSGAGTVDNTGAGTVTLTVGDNNASGAANTFSGVIKNTSGTLNLLKNGSGTLTLSGVNTFTGFLSVREGTLSIATINNEGANGVLGAGAAFLGDAGTTGTLQYTGGTTASTKNFSIVPGATGVFQIDTLATALTLSGVIDGSGNVTKTGLGSLVLSGINTYGGVTTISNGVLSVGILVDGGIASGIGASANGAANLIINGGTLRYTGAAVSSDRLFSVGTPGGTIDASGTGALNLNNTGTMGFNGQTGARTLTLTGSNTGANTLAAVVGDNAGATSLTKSGVGTWALSGANTYSGATTISAGTLRLGASEVIPDGVGKGNIAVTGVLDLNTFSETINGLSGAGTVDTLAGGTVAFMVGNNDQTSTFSGGIKNTLGTLALTKIGTGTLTLSGASGANTYSGDTTISAGTLAVGADNTLPFGSGKGNVVIGSAGTLSLAGASININGLSGSGTVDKSDTANAETLTFGNNNSTASFSGVITNSDPDDLLSVTKVGTGTQTLAGNNSYRGATTISAGALQISHASALGAATGTAANSTTVASGAALELINNIAVGNEALSLSGTGIGSGGALRNISGDNSWGGVITLAAATRINSDLGTLTIDSAGNITGATFALTVGGAGNVTISDPIATTTGTLTKDGAGVLTLNATNSYSGNTRVVAGGLTLGHAGALGNTTLDLNGADLGTLSFGTLTAATFGGLTGSRDLTLENTTPAAVALSVGNNNGSTTYSGILSGAGSLTKIGTGTLTLGGVNTYTGKTTISAGTLSINAEEKLGGDPGVLTADQLTLNGGTLQTTATFAIDDSNRGVTLAANSGINVNATTTLTIANVITGTGSLTNTGAGTLVLGGVNTYTGKTIINAGTLSISAEENLGANPGVFTADQLTLNGGTLQTTADVTINDLNRGITLGANDGTFNVNSSTTLAVDSVIAGVAGGLLTKSGTGTLILNANNTFAGGLTVGAGTFVFGHNSAAGTGILTLTDGVTLQGTGGPRTIDNPLVIASATYGGSEDLTFTDSFDQVSSRTYTVDNTTTFSGVISGNDALTKAGTGIMVLGGTAANTYSGLTTVNAGTLRLSKTAGVNAIAGNLTIGDGIGIDTVQLTAANQIADASTVTITSSGVFDLNGNSEGIASLTMTGGSVTTGAGTLTNSGAVTGNAAAASATISGNLNLGGAVRTFTIGDGAAANDMDISAVIANGGLTKAGTGTLRLSGANTYTNTTSVGAGILLLDNANALPGGIGTAGGTSALTFSGGVLGLGNGDFTRNLGTTGTTNVQFTAGGGFAAYGANRLVNFGGASAGVTWNAGSFVPTGSALILGSSDATHTVTVENPIGLGTATRTVQANDGGADIDGILSGVISSGAGAGLTKTGTGTLGLTGNNSYTGNTTVSAGALNIQHANALGATGAGNTTTVSGGAALQLQGNITTAAEALTLNGAGVGGSGGALRNISGDNTYAGAVTLGSASRINSDSGTLTLSGGITTSGNALTIGGAGNVIVNTVGISGTGSLTKDGAGTLNLNVASAYTGGTTLSQGTLSLGANDALGTGGFTFAGGILNANNTTDNTIGTLSLTADSTLNLVDDLTAGQFTFTTTSGSAVGMLTITGWTGTQGGAGDGDRVFFSGTNPDSTFLSHIQFDISGTLFYADMSGNELVAGITPVPEPITVALGLFGVVFAGIGIGRRYFASRRSD